jgi:adenosylmethionine-8-amino-7-oxononanoate aminotransferase
MVVAFMLLVAAIVLGLSGRAAAQGTVACAPRALLAEQLERQHHERPRVQAMRDNGAMLVVYVSDDDRTYTIVSINPLTQVACAVDSGEYWTTQRNPETRGG